MFFLSIVTVIFTVTFMIIDLYYTVPSQFAADIGSIRTSIVNRDCEVPFHNWVDPTILGELCKRPETQKAFENGFAFAYHFSPTLHEDAYYVAVRINHDQVLKLTLSKQEFYQFTHALIRDIIIGLCLSSLVVFLLSWLITRRVIKPFKNTTIDEYENSVLVNYPEIKPFIDTIKEHERNLKNIAKHRAQFSANVSHELRTPLAEILAMSQTIASGKLNDKEVHEFSCDIVKSSKKLSNLINEILELSRFDEGTIDIKKTSVNVVYLVESAINKFSKLAKEKNVTYQIEKTNDKIFIKADLTLYSIVVSNLIENATKYSYHDQKVIIKISDIGFSVNNQCDVISEDVLPRLFERFYRTDTARTSNDVNGYGLGLAFVNNIIKAHNGFIEVTSDKINGTTFSVSF